MELVKKEVSLDAVHGAGALPKEVVWADRSIETRHMDFMGGTNDDVPMRVSIIVKGDVYGHNNCLTHDKDEPLAEFRELVHGQVPSRYYVSTLISAKDMLGGLCLDGRVPNWVVSAQNMIRIRVFLIWGQLPRCLCRVCERQRMLHLLLKDSPAAHRDFFMSMYESLLEAETDLAYHKGILNGAWPGAQDILERALKSLQ